MVQMHMMIVNYGCGTCRSKPCANSFAPMFFFNFFISFSPEKVSHDLQDEKAVKGKNKTGTFQVGTIPEARKAQIF